jgi:ABC-type lipoprotein release transport system permease subunit
MHTPSLENCTSKIRGATFMSTLSRLIRFKYLKGRRVLTLAIILTLSSALFSITAFSLLGFYRGFTAYLGEAEDVVAIYNRKGSTPFTGLVPAYLAGRVSSINGVIACSPETIAPCIIKGESIFLRGIVPEDFAKLNQLTMVEGNMLELDDVNCVIVGRNAAVRLNLKLNDEILVLGVLADRYLQLQVKGIYESHSVMDDEVLAPLYVGQWLRGTDYGHVTLIRVKIDRSVVSPAAIFEEVAKEASEPNQDGGQKPPEGLIIPWLRAPFRVEDIGVEEAQRFMKSYLDRYGVTRESLLTLSVMVFLFSSATVAVTSKTIITQHKGEINVLRSLGASKKLLKRDVLIKLLPWTLIASSIGVTLAIVALTAIQAYGYLQVLSHSITFQLDPLIIALNFIFAFTLVSVGILKTDLE